MILSYIKLALRQLRLSKTYSVINVVGLSSGLASCFIILVYVRYQTSFDKYNANLDNVYVVTSHKESVDWTDPGTPMILGPTLRDEIPDVREVARWDRIRSSMEYNNSVFEEKACVFADLDIFNILTLPLVQGDLNVTRRERDFLIISETLARKYFGDRNAIGEIITLKCVKSTYELKITGVMKDIPKTSTFVADAVGPLYIAQKFLIDIWGSTEGDPAVSWTVPGVTTYVALAPSAGVSEIEAKLVGLSKQHLDPKRGETFHLFPLKDVYFHSSFMVNNLFPQGDIAKVFVYTAVAFLLLFIACVNYLMLSLGKASLRTREVGVRIVFGAHKSDLFRQTLVEATLMTFISLPIALALVELLLRNVTGLLGTTISAKYFHNWEYLIAFAALTIGVGLIAGSYVTLYLSSINPIDIFKKKQAAGSRKVFLRRTLLTSQMIIFLSLTLASLTIHKQLGYLQNMDMGFDKERLFVFYPESEEFSKVLQVFKSEVEKNPEVINVSGANILPGSGSRGVSKIPRRDNPTQLVVVEGGCTVDQDFIETMGMRIVEGVSFRKHISGDEGRYCIINETAAKELGLTDPVGEEVAGSTVIGVVGDFNMHSLHERIGPMLFRQGTTRVNEIAVRIAPGDDPGTANWVAGQGARFNDGKPLEFESFEERLGGLYTHEQKFATAIGYATGLAIFVACLGILGMSIFVCQQKVKEIGIRRVLGATFEHLYYKLTREFVELILLSTLIAFPLTAYFVNVWLTQFAYHIDLSVWDLLLTVAIDTVIVLATVSYQTVKAALANPVSSLRYE